MSRTDKTRPWWVRLAEAPMVTCVPVHDHRSGVCTLPEAVTADNAAPTRRAAGCHWGGTARHPIWRDTKGSHREWRRMRREDRRRDRHRARRELRTGHGEE
ncbi:hypothetical protein [Saccharothrix texasensis]|uniref:Uncharacterized protein n=1 Tax=Saccharothrix texasensis TaxID=103734 RepID=A0A3N1HJG3_9PSEU|nr:hypothetical protein [Saccharothrix texasensis]ROP42663.1 hypothetical protein EDD40_8171 [Saccharothrix texasensis]